jgi:toxin CcdB
MAGFLMARFDVFRNPGKTASVFPFFLDVQSNHISGLATRIVIPLRAVASLKVIQIPGDLCPVVEIGQQRYFLDTPQLGAIPCRELTDLVTSLAEKQTEIIGALDKVFGGY